MTLHEVQAAIDQWIRQFREGYWPPMANLARITEEVGELARELNHAHGPKRKKADEAPGSVEEELADIVIACATLANSLQIDLDAAVARSIEKLQIRDARRFERVDDPPGS